jgi:hypothetical protein
VRLVSSQLSDQLGDGPNQRRRASQHGANGEPIQSDAASSIDGFPSGRHTSSLCLLGEPSGTDGKYKSKRERYH